MPMLECGKSKSNSAKTFKSYVRNNTKSKTRPIRHTQNRLTPILKFGRSEKFNYALQVRYRCLSSAQL